MSQITIREDGNVSYENDAYHFQCDLKIETLFPQGEFLPPSVRYTDSNMIVLEFPPCHHLVRVSDSNYGDERVFRIPTPWTIFVINHDLSIFARPSQMKSLDDDLCAYYLPNIHGDHTRCQSEYDVYRTQGIPNALEMASGFWHSRFSGGFYLYGSNFCDQLPTDIFAHLKDANDRPIPDYGTIRWIEPYPYFEWLETLSLDDLLAWNWQPVAKITDWTSKEEIFSVLATRCQTNARTRSVKRI